MKLTTGVTSLLLSAVDNDLFFFISQLLTMKLTESTNICYISDRVILVGRTDSSYSITTLGNPWTHVRQGWYYKVWQPVMNPPELLLKIFEANFEIYWE